MKNLSTFTTGISSTIAVLMVLAGWLFLAIPAHAAKCTWTVEGKAKVQHQLSELKDKYGTISPLVGIKVKLQARKKVAGLWGSWAKWDEKVTASDGSFKVTRKKSCDGTRQFKVSFKFQSDDFEVRHANATSSLTKVKWYEVHNDKSKNVARTSHSINLGDLTFRPPQKFEIDATGETKWLHSAWLTDGEARDHADIWVTYSALLDKLSGYGYPFKKQLAVKYPHNSFLANDNVENSYANPFTNVVYIYKSNDGNNDHLNIDTLLHEAMHIWVYQHSSGESDLAVNLLASGDTHCYEPTHIAFHEGFAEWASERLGNILFGVKPIPKPFNRDALKNGTAVFIHAPSCKDRITSLAQMEEHEYGWASALRLLALKKLNRYTFNQATSGDIFISKHGNPLITKNCQEPAEFSYKEILGIFVSKPEVGYPKELSKKEMNFESFFARAAAILDMPDANREGLLALLDPNQSSDPMDIFCENKHPTPKIKNLSPKGGLAKPSAALKGS